MCHHDLLQMTLKKMTLTVAMANPSLSFEFVLCGDMLLSQLKEYRTQDVCYGS